MARKRGGYNVIDFDGFQNYLYEEELSKNTIDCYMLSLRQFQEHYDEITKANMIGFKQMLIAKGFKPGTVNLRITGLLAYCKYKDISMKMKHIKEPKKTHVENVITADQVEMLLNCLSADGRESWRVNVLLLAKTGMRISEALRIKKRDILNGSVTLHTKAHMRTIYFPKSLADDIKGYLEKLNDDDTVMRTKFGKPMTSRGVAEGLKRYGKLYGIPKEVMHPHAFRHFFAIEFLKRNNNIALLADILGHSDVKMTQLYLRQSQEQQQDAVNKAVNW